VTSCVGEYRAAATRRAQGRGRGPADPRHLRLQGPAGAGSHRVPALSVPARGGGAEETYLEVAAGVTLIILTGRYFELAAGDEFVVRPGAGLVEDGQNGIAQVQRLADRVSAVSVPVGS
jgi:Cu+-exporting ATPase